MSSPHHLHMGHITASQHGLALSVLYVLQQGGKQPDWWRDNIGREVAQSAPQPAPQSGSRQEFEQNLGKGVSLNSARCLVVACSPCHEPHGALQAASHVHHGHNLAQAQSKNMSLRNPACSVTC